jgi:hypothetical protein
LAVNEFTESLNGKVRSFDENSDDVLRRYKKYMIASGRRTPTMAGRLRRKNHGEPEERLLTFKTIT